jgi:hypothetical protein
LPPNRALMSAFDLAATPTLAPQVRRHPLPDGVLDVIRIAAGCEATLEAVAWRYRKDPRFVKAAAQLYVQQILLFQAADSYRVLGVRPGAARDEMRTHMRWLMTWVHPDHANADWQTVFAARVLAAWRDVSNAPPVEVPAAASPRFWTPPAPRLRLASHKIVQRRRWWRRYLKFLPLFLALSVAAGLSACDEWRDAAYAASWLQSVLYAAMGGLTP